MGAGNLSPATLKSVPFSELHALYPQRWARRICTAHAALRDVASQRVWKESKRSQFRGSSQADTVLRSLPATDMQRGFSAPPLNHTPTKSLEKRPEFKDENLEKRGCGGHGVLFQLFWRGWCYASKQVPSSLWCFYLGCTPGFPPRLHGT